MTFSINRVTAMIQKEWKEAMRNQMLLITAALPLIFAFMFSNGTIDDGATLLMMPINMALLITCLFAQSMMVAEEKEKHTLRVLMLSPAKPIEVLLGKSAISVFLTLCALIATFLIAKTPGLPLIGLAMLIVPSLIMYVAFGTLTGLLSRTTMETSFVGMPLMIVFLMGPAFSNVFNSSVVDTIVAYLPTSQLSEAAQKLWDGQGLFSISIHVGIITIWMAASIIITLIAYRSKRYDA
ncbi:ABC transporter permease [Paenibacillus alvei]|uniref:ABC transporter permease n=1 Tax=Paenibacillus alvei TaxID=44250 RepID=A0AAP6ZZ34_PAEAL|nr:ABC transporter permease [Paenibacillus alvei]MBG9735190.1 ABC transporter [Paenibacillus alvei]MBG9743648.1 ABC transporter [Paenibacillus alvei]MCY9580058.1 ABC transporter permease [Paenibacillus alvei]MCY9584232.1 ABC transporter permease [Paenibacillus alvei]NEZ44832.1 ABC transporter permease [Paenibacillus alvei]